ncbi:EpsG family protein [Sphingomonas sp.]|uniref:EpsG family protein n=1 Tax=Sphingomonas sp. TaxID=28214 RepID=UPI003B3B3350
MLIYWLLLAFPAAAAVIALRSEDTDTRPYLLALAGFWLVYNLLSGLRFEIGGDWSNYSDMIEAIRHEPLEFALGYGDFAFNLMAWVSTRIGLDLYGINALCSMILSAGVITIARRTPAPWLALTAAVPYLLIVVGMGYIRQAAAIGFMLMAIAAFCDRRTLIGMACLVLGTLFHVATLLILPLIGLALIRRNTAATVLVALVGAVITNYALAEGRVEAFQAGYLDTGYSSSGTLVRILINLVPALIYLLRRKALNLDPIEDMIWSLVAVACILCVPAFLLSPSSTAVDRVGLFFSPIQVFVFGYLLRALQDRGPVAVLVALGVIAYCAAIQFVWLGWADNSEYWVPYRSILDRTAIR